MRISGTCFLDDGTGRSAAFEMTEEGEHCLVVVRHAGSRHEGKSLRAARWLTFDRLTDEAFKSIPDNDAPPKWDLNRKFKKPTPVRRRLPTGLPEWRPPETD
jgi:hypothetical protein